MAIRVQEQIEILKQVKLRLLACDSLTNSIHLNGLCWFLRNSILSMSSVNSIMTEPLHCYIDGFTFQNAIELSIKYNFLKPNGIPERFWWNDVNWNVPRIAFLNALITELEQNI